MLGVADTNILCTLTKAMNSSNSDISLIPIARSYDENLWEQSAGEFAASIFEGEEILCYSVGCQVNLPPLEAGAEYLLSSFSHSLPAVDEYARFLETATFGTTQEQLDVFATYSGSVQDNIASWLLGQMNSTVTPITSHRENWRKGLNGRVSEGSCHGLHIYFFFVT